MNRLEMLKSIAQKNGEKSPATKTAEPRLTESAVPLERPKNEPEKTPPPETATWIESMGQPKLSSQPSAPSKTKLKTIPTPSELTPNLDGPPSVETQAIGNENTPEEKPTAIVPATTQNDAPPALTLENLRNEIWENLQALKRKQVDPSFVKEFTKGCTAIMRSVKLDMDAQEIFGGGK